jgi:hypothetical protein
MTQILVVPAKDRKVRDPRTMKPIRGAVSVSDTDVYWARRLIAGDVVVTSPEQEAARLKLIADTKAEAAAAAKVSADQAAPSAAPTRAARAN